MEPAGFRRRIPPPVRTTVGSSENQPQLRILLAISQPDECTAVKQFLKEKGYKVLAIKAASQVVLGLNLLGPGFAIVDSIEVLNAMRATRYGSDLPVFVILRDHSDQAIFEAFQAGADSYILSPIDFEDWYGLGWF